MNPHAPMKPGQTGKITIEWTRISDSAPIAERYNWHIEMEPSGMSDADISTLLIDIADRLF
jgi:hypothetical protein